MVDNHHNIMGATTISSHFGQTSLLLGKKHDADLIDAQQHTATSAIKESVNSVFSPSLSDFAPLAWLAQRSIVKRAARLLTLCYGLTIYPRDVVAMLHFLLALCVALCPLQLHTGWHMLMGMWMAYTIYGLKNFAVRVSRETDG